MFAIEMTKADGWKSIEECYLESPLELAFFSAYADVAYRVLTDYDLGEPAYLGEMVSKFAAADGFTGLLECEDEEPEMLPKYEKYAVSAIHAWRTLRTFPSMWRRPD